MSTKISKTQTKQIAEAYKAKAINGVDLSTATLDEPVKLYTFSDWVGDHSTNFYIIVGLSVLTGYYLCNFHSTEPPVYIYSESYIWHIIINERN